MSKHQSSKTRKTSRRTVVKALATVPLLPVVSTETSSQQPAQTEPSPAARALMDLARERYGKHLTPEQLDEVRKDIVSGIGMSERLRARKLNNSDEPDFVFRALS
jgi:hypothetical protein